MDNFSKTLKTQIMKNISTRKNVKVKNVVLLLFKNIKKNSSFFSFFLIFALTGLLYSSENYGQAMSSRFSITLDLDTTTGQFVINYPFYISNNSVSINGNASQPDAFIDNDKDYNGSSISYNIGSHTWAGILYYIKASSGVSMSTSNKDDVGSKGGGMAAVYFGYNRVDSFYMKNNDPTTAMTQTKWDIGDNNSGITQFQLYINKLNRRGSDSPTDEHDITKTSKTINVPLLGNLKINSYLFADKNNATLSWSSDDNSTSRHSYTVLYDNNGDSIAVSPYGRTSGSITIPQDAKPRYYFLFQKAYDGRVTLKSAAFLVPAFTHPASLTGTYDAGKVNLTWQLPLATGDANNGEVVTSGFKMQRATKSDFSDAVNVDISAISYDQTNTTYTYSDDIHNGAIYRLARNYTTNPNWGWTDAVTYSFSGTHAGFDANSNAQVVNNSDNLSAVITWKPTPNYIWTSGASFKIVRTNKTNATVTTFDGLTEDDYKLGKYIDSLMTPCNIYSYTLQVVPAGWSGYPTLKALAVNGTATPIQIGNVSNLIASKGYYQDRTELSWNTIGNFDNFIVKRRVYNSGANFNQIATLPGNPSGTVLYTDPNGLPGVYYEYSINGVVNCSGTVKASKDTLIAIGFRSPTGTIYGRITYNNGQAVSGAAVRLQASDNTLQTGQSMLFNGKGYLRIDSLNTPFVDTAFSIEAWVKPADAMPKNQVVFSSGNQYEFGYDANGQLYFSYKGTTISTSNAVFPSQRYYHIAAVYGKDSSYIIMNDSLLKVSVTSNSISGNSIKTATIGGNSTGKNYKGNIDEMRAWNTAVTPMQIIQNYTRLLAGNEPFLAGYWRFDETIKNQFYDISNKDGVYNRNDGTMDDSTEVVHSSVIPTTDQLALKGFTDSTGNYMISGIPYTANGPTYKVVPLLGTHQFNPSSVNRLLSDRTNSYTVDFVDNSAFPVSGTVYYRNSTVPVQGATFTVDGQYAQQSNGTLITSDASGNFSINVPIGVHEVKVVKANHGFTYGGKIINIDGSNRNYQSAVSGLVLYDTTTVRFIGRIAGGTIQENLPLGHSISKNNLGDNPSLTLQLTGVQNRKINASPTNTDSIVTVKHFLPSNQPDSSKAHKTWVEYKDYSITIHPDSVTGEFFADIIPESFSLTSAKTNGQADIIGNNPVSIDFSNVFTIQKDGYAYKDSTQIKDTVWNYKNYTDSVPYNASYKAILRVNPVLNVQQLNVGNGIFMSYFGDSSYSVSPLAGAPIPIDLYNSKTGKYSFGNPVFLQNRTYSFAITSFEEYKYNGKNNMIDRVPSQNALISVDNELNARASAGGPDTLSLNNFGAGIYSFTCGEPNLDNGSGLKGFSISETVGSQITQWNNGIKQNAYIMGGHVTGSNFVTTGPDEIAWMLRDPPGANSFSTLSAGSTSTTTRSYIGTAAQSGDQKLDVFLGNSTTTFTGLGAGVIVKLDVENSQGVHTSHSESYTGTNTHVTTRTLLTTYQTSSSPDYVGANGDVFIGNSTNITVSAAINLNIIRNVDVQSTDVVFWDGSKNNSLYSIVQRTGLNVGQSYGTQFVYPQLHIEQTLIPNLRTLRNSFLMPYTMSATDAQSRANSTSAPIYVSKLANTDPNFGASNYDEVAFGSNAKDNESDDGPSYHIYYPTGAAKYNLDTISFINQTIANWIKVLSENEKAKVNATRKVENYSFTGGSSVSQSLELDATATRINSFNFVLSAAFIKTTGITINKAGARFTLEEGLSTEQGGSFQSDNTTSNNFGFTLSENGSNYISVDVLRAPDSSYVFKIKGGVTSCPYEGAYISKYYQPNGKGEIIDQPTVQVEKPNIAVTQPVVGNVPSNKQASYTIQMNNAGDSKSDASFLLKVDDKSNPYGAKVFMDGTDLGTGRVVPVPYGQILSKTITLQRGPDSMNYKNVQLILASTCQSSLADTIAITAQFIPSCSDIYMKAPNDKWVVNTLSPADSTGSRYLPVTLDGFDINNSQFDHIELQYKSASDAIWTTVMKFYSDSTKMKAAQGGKQMITGNGTINYNLVMNDASFSDQTYNLQAVSYCMDNGQVVSTSQTVMLTGIKDTYSPRLFGSPQPANGVLAINDNIMLTFNEAIAGGLLSQSDFQVTGVRNGAIGDHSVSVNLDGQSNFIATEFSKNFSGKSITAEMWINPSSLKAGTLFSQGDANAAMEMSLTSDNYLQVTVGGNTVKSDKPVGVQQGQWSHVALEYNAQDTTVSAFFNFVEVIHANSVSKYAGSGILMYGNSLKSGNSYFAGKIHEARVWTKTIPATTLQTQSLTMLSGAEDGLLAYYPMNEGIGTLINEKARGSNGKLTGTWSMPPGKAITLKGNGYVDLNTSGAPVTSTMDYTLQLWFKAAAGQSNATLISNGKGDGTDFGTSKNQFNLVFQNGQLVFVNNGFTAQATGNYLDNQWHQATISVNHVSGVGQVYVDGVMNTYFDAKNVGGLVSSDTYLGARRWKDSVTNGIQTDRYFTGNIDEVRIWNTYTPQALISNNLNARLSGTEAGLLAYYPFEKYTTFQGTQQMVYTPSDQTVQTQAGYVVPDAVLTNAVSTDDMAPIKDKGPVANLQFNYVVNNNQLLINLLESKQAIDKTIVTMRASNVRDLNGNPLLSPITWTAYINQNPLKWGDDSLSYTKDANAALQFTSYIVNTGGSVQNFRLTNLPNWLTAVPSSGSVGPLGKQPVTFTVNPGLNVGSYDEVVYMLNDNNQSQALPISVKVLGKDPGWTVNPADYKYNMTVLGKIRINNIYSNDGDDKLAVFSNGKCVGVTNNVYNASNDLWYTFLTIYSNNVQGDTLSFRIWDASVGKVYQGVPSTNVSFSNGAIVGTTTSPIIFDGKDMVYQNIPLNAGWNWVSFNLRNPDSSNLNSALSNASWASGDLIKDMQTFDQYSSNGGWVGTLTGLNNTSMFMINSSKAQTLSYSGTTAGLTALPLKVSANRWSYISYLPSINKTVKEGLAGYNPTPGDVIKSQTGFAMYDAQNGWIGNLTYLEPGKGYMLFRNSNTDGTFVYGTLGGGLGSAPNNSNNTIRLGTFSTVNDKQIPVAANFQNANNMTILAQVDKGFSLQNGDLVNAYVGGELVSQAASIQNPITGGNSFYINIAGDASKTIYFSIERNGREVATSTTSVPYVSDARMGTLDKPMTIAFNNLSAQIVAYPNPFRSRLNIQVPLPNNGFSLHTVVVSVFDLSGRCVFQKPAENVVGSVYQTSWDGNNGALAPGFYLVQVNIDGKTQFIKVAKQ